jgi:hypothetical protein
LTFDAITIGLIVSKPLFNALKLSYGASNSSFSTIQAVVGMPRPNLLSPPPAPGDDESGEEEEAQSSTTCNAPSRSSE